jgi:hypothetical protein
MKLYFITLSLILLTLSCKKNNNAPAGHNLSGSYSGIFYRTGMDTAGVVINFNGNNFDGQSNRPKYPAICRGSFDLDATTINFIDSCQWTADFDWSLILNGNYNIDFKNDGTVRIWKTNGYITDEYSLTRLIR